MISYPDSGSPLDTESLGSRSTCPRSLDVIPCLTHSCVGPMLKPSIGGTLMANSSYTVYLVAVLWRAHRGLSRREVLGTVEERRRAHRLHIPASIEESIQNAFNAHNIRSSVSKDPEDGFFWSRHDGAEATWGLAKDVLLQSPWFSRHSAEVRLLADSDPRRDLVQALVSFSGRPKAQVEEFLSDKGPPQLLALCESLKVRPILERIRLERDVENTRGH